MRRRIIDGHAVMERRGAGPAWLLLHGFTGSPRSFETLISHLPSQAALIAVTLPGHGSRLRTESSQDFSQAVAALARVLRRAGHPRVRVLGYSLGARLGFGLASLFPMQISGLVALGGHPGLRDPVERLARRRSDRETAQRLETEGLPPFMARWQALPLFASQSALPAWCLAQQARIRATHNPRQLAGALRQLSLADMPDWRPHLKGFPGPIDLVVGARDKKFTELNTALARDLPQAKLHVLPGVGHNPVLEAPGRIAGLMTAARGSGIGERLRRPLSPL